MMISRLAKVYVSVDIASPQQDVTNDVATMAFVDYRTQPADDTVWVAAEWAEEGTTLRCLVGPDGGTELDPGVYGVWVRIVDTPEAPVLRSGWLAIT